MIESHQVTDIWWASVLLVWCPAKPEVPWLRCACADCATFEDNILSCIVPDVQMYSRCVPVHPDVIVLYQHCYILCTLLLLCGRCVYY